MAEESAKAYSKIVQIDLNEKVIYNNKNKYIYCRFACIKLLRNYFQLSPVNAIIDGMLARLEELETMILLVQQERQNTVGPNGSITQIIDNIPELNELCGRIDNLEKLVEHIKQNINYLEEKVEAAENEVGLPNSTNKLKTLLKPLLVSINLLHT